jgi:hypothetical protein
MVMPNYVRNVLILDGEDADKVFSFIDGDDSGFDFNKVIPMPSSLAIESSSMMELSYACEIYRNEKIVLDILQYRLVKGETIPHLIKRLKKEHQVKDELGKVAYENKKLYGATDWYGWCVNHWGTKWNAMEVSLGNYSIEFETAWSAPIPVIEKLAELFPTVTFTHTWADEDLGNNCGEVVYSNGNAVDWFYPEDRSSEAFEIYEKCWGKSPCIGTDDNGKKYYKGCENCNGCDAKENAV